MKRILSFFLTLVLTAALLCPAALAVNETAAKAATGDAKVSDIFDTAQKTSVEALKNAKLPVKE